jgi:hypothetical protein
MGSGVRASSHQIDPEVAERASRRHDTGDATVLACLRRRTQFCTVNASID